MENNNNATICICGIPLINDEYFNQKSELLQWALISPKVSEDMLETISKKLQDNTLEYSKIVNNIKLLRSSNSFTEADLDIIQNKI